MARHYYQGIFLDDLSNPVTDGLCTVYLTRTTTLATIYTASSGGVGTNTVYTDSNGKFVFYISDSDYSSTQLFKYTLSAKYVTTQVYNDVLVMVIATVGRMGKNLDLNTYNILNVGSEGLKLLDTGEDHDLTIKPNEDLSADRILNIVVNDSDQTLTIPVPLSDLANPGDDTSISFNTKDLEFIFTTGNFEIEGRGAFASDLLHIYQHTGNPGATNLLHLHAEDADVVGLRVHNTQASTAIAIGESGSETFTIADTGTINLYGQSITGTSVDINNAEMQQLSNIGATTISAVQWGALGNLPVFNVKHYGAVPDGETTTDTTSINNAIAALNSAGRGRLYFPGGSSYYKVDTTNLTTITVPCIIEGDGAISQIKQTTDQKGLFDIVSSDSVIVRNITLVGPGAAQVLYTGADGLHIAGTNAANPAHYIKIENVTMHNFQGHGILLDFIDRFEISGCNLLILTYAGIFVKSCKHGRIHHNYINSILCKSADNNGYGIAVSSASGDLVTYPPSENVSVDHNTISEVLIWEGIDTHGAKDITIDSNRIYSCHVGILAARRDSSITGKADANHATICTDQDGRTMATLGAYIGAAVSNDTDGSTGTISAVSTDTFTAILGGGGDNSWDVDDEYTINAWHPPENTIISNNLIDSKKTDGSRAVAIYLANQDANNYATGSIIGNMVIGHGFQATEHYGAILIRFSKSVNIEGNTIIDPSPVGIEVSQDNKDFSIFGNNIIDPWAETDHVVAGVYVTDGGNNTGFIDGLNVAKDTKSATYEIDGANGYAVYEENAATNNVSLGTYKSEANTAIFDGGQVTDTQIYKLTTAISKTTDYVYAEALRVGTDADPGNNNFQVDGTSTLTGDVGIGTAPSYQLDVYETGQAYIARFTHDGDNAARNGLLIQAGADDGVGLTYFLRCLDGDGGEVGYLEQTAGHVLQVAQPSDIRLKENIEDTKIDGVDIIKNLRVRDFNLIRAPGIDITGFIAQEVEGVYAPAVSRNEEEDIWSVASAAFIMPLVKATQQQQTIIEQLEARIQKLENTT